MNKKILLTAVTGCRNHGVEALVDSIVSGMAATGSGVAVDVMSWTPDYDKLHAQDKSVSYVLDEWRVTTAGFKVRLRRKLGRFFLALDDRRSVLAAYDLLVVSGGDMFGADYGTFTPELAPLHMAKSLGIPYVFIGQSVGPFTSKAQIREWTEAARGAQWISSRESLTHKYLAEDLSLPAEFLSLAPDPAFLLPVAPDSPRLRALIVGDAHRPFVAFSASQGIVNFAQSGADAHLNALIAAIDHVVEEWDRDVILLPHVHETYCWNDDSELSLRIAQAVRHPARVHLAPVHLSARQFKALIADADFVIAERMHAAIAALSTARPVFCVGYSVKYRGILGDIFGLDTASGELLIGVKELGPNRRLTDMLDLAWSKREVYEEILTAKREDLVTGALDNFRRIHRTLESSGRP